MKINCYEIKVDIDKILQGRDNYYIRYNEKPLYIVMNSRTRKAIKEQLPIIPSGRFPIYYEIPEILFDMHVAISEKLKDGEVDIVGGNFPHEI
jgi:hypothetical protein